MTPATIRMAQTAAMVERDTKVGDLCEELAVTRQTPQRRTATRRREAS
jgi:hypothetical protein